MKFTLSRFTPFSLMDIIVFLTKTLTVAQSNWHPKSNPKNQPQLKQRIYFANHTSNLDTIIIWSALPYKLRKHTRPVAAADYWDNPGIRGYIAKKELNVVFVHRDSKTNPQSADPIASMSQALQGLDSLIIFPEGQRNKEVVPAVFKSGLYQLHKNFPHIELIPVYLENVSKTFPRGAPFPLPLICKAHFGAPWVFEEFDNPYLEEKQKRTQFLSLARQAVIDLIPSHIKQSTTNYQEMLDNPPVRD